MASREMINVLDRLRDLDKVNPNVHSDALENTEKLNPPVEEAKKKMVKDPKTGKMVPSYAIDGKGKDDLKKENVKESRKAPKEVKKLMAGKTYTCEDCGCEMHKCDKDCDCKNDSHDELGSYWKDENGNGIPDVAESVNESITISADSESDLPMIAQIMKLAGMSTVTPDMMPGADNVPMMKSDDDINANDDDDCGCEDDDNTDMPYSEQDRLAQLAGIERTQTEATSDMQPGQGALDKFRELHRKGIGSNDDEVVLKELIEAINDDSLFADEFTALRAFTSPSKFDDSEIVTADDVPGNTPDEKIETLLKAIDDDSWVGGFAEMLMKDFSMSDDGDEDTEEGFANSMGDEKEEPTYKGYDPDYAKDAGAATRKTKQVPANSGDNPLESIEDKLRTEYKTFKEELWKELSDGKESTDEGRGRGKLMAGRGRGKMPKENVQTQYKDDMFKSMSDAGAYNGGKTVKTSNKKPGLKGNELDALRNKNVAKMDAEDKAARKANKDRLASYKK